ncbi:MAG: MoaD/ThiS family protein [Thermoproteota archaeon]
MYCERNAMRVKVRAFGDLAKIAGREVTVDVPSGATIGDLLVKLGLMSERSVWDTISGKDQNQRMVILLGGLNIEFLEKERTRLSEGDTVSLLPLAGGG